MKKFLVLAFAILFSLPAQAHDQLDHSIIVNGIGEVEVAVDTVNINVGLSTRDKDLEKAKAENQKKYDEVLKAITKHGLDKNSIKSNFVSVNPSYVPCYPTEKNPNPKCDQTKIDYYEASRNLEIKLTDLKKYDAVINDLSKVGASYVNTGQFDISEKTKYKDQARDLAIDAAKAKATKVAAKLGVKINKPIRFESQDDEANYPHPVMAQSFKMANMEAAPADAATDTEAMGKIKVRVTVSIAYGIE